MIEVLSLSTNVDLYLLYRFDSVGKGRHTKKLIGASLSEPHINGTAMRELYIYILLWYVGHAKLYSQ